VTEERFWTVSLNTVKSQGFTISVLSPPGGLNRAMQLMEAESVAQLPRGAQWQYEPKWDGFRCLLIRERSQVSMQSKSGRDLVRYFPEIAAAAADLSPKTLNLDGEFDYQLDERYSFDALLKRIHPAASPVKHLAKKLPQPSWFLTCCDRAREIFRICRL
jgi:ATP-dependent DNA ligase